MLYTHKYEDADGFAKYIFLSMILEALKIHCLQISCSINFHDLPKCLCISYEWPYRHECGVLLCLSQEFV